MFKVVVRLVLRAMARVMLRVVVSVILRVGVRAVVGVDLSVLMTVVLRIMARVINTSERELEIILCSNCLPISLFHQKFMSNYKYCLIFFQVLLLLHSIFCFFII